MKYFVISLCIFASLFSSSLFAEPVKEWTFMVYLNADNNLDSFGVGDQNEMAKVGSNDWLNIVTLIDRENAPATLNYIEKGNVKPLKAMGELDMGDYNQLVSFVKDTVAQFPAKKYALVIWNHGSGWKNQNNIIKGISYDDSSNNHITTSQLGIAMNQIKQILGKNLEVLDMDACLMQMVEVLYVMQDSVDYIVGSEETEPGNGNPYDKILGKLTINMSSEDFSKVFVTEYAASYNNGSQGNSATTKSSVKANELANLKDTVDGFSKAVMVASCTKQVKDALAKTQRFYYSTNIDLGDLVNNLKVTAQDQGILNAINKLEEQLGKTVVSNATTQPKMAKARGLAIYFPGTASSFDNSYNNLAFAQDSLWDDMVKDYYVKSTVPAIIADLEHGDITSLVCYTRTANNKELNQNLISQLNFHLYAEQDVNNSIKDNVRVIVKDLIAVNY